MDISHDHICPPPHNFWRFYFPFYILCIRKWIFFKIYSCCLQCYIYPTLVGDFYGILGIPDMWLTPDDMKADQAACRVYIWIFIWCSINLIVSIVLTIKTNPGNIPEDVEWDMPSSEGAPSDNQPQGMDSEQRSR